MEWNAPTMNPPLEPRRKTSDLPTLSLSAVAMLLAATHAFAAAEGPIDAVQKALKREHFLPGEPSGVLDEPTRVALRRFQANRGLRETGEIDTATLQALQSDTETAKPTLTALPDVKTGAAVETVAKDREFLKQVEEAQPPAPPAAEQVAEIAEAPRSEPAPPPTEAAEPPAEVDPLHSPAVAFKNETLKRQPEMAKVKPVEKSRRTVRIERAIPVAPDDRRDLAPEPVSEPPRLSRFRFSTAPERTAVNEAEVDVTAGGGARIIRATTPRPESRVKKTPSSAPAPLPGEPSVAPPEPTPKVGFLRRIFRRE
jgi:hypothetical protein